MLAYFSRGLMGTHVAECLRLAAQGGPTIEHRRGMSLWEITGSLDFAMSQLLRLDELILAQRALVERESALMGEHSFYAVSARQMLARLEEIQLAARDNNLTKKELAHLVLEYLVDFEHDLGPEQPATTH